MNNFEIIAKAKKVVENYKKNIFLTSKDKTTLINLKISLLMIENMYTKKSEIKKLVKDLEKIITG